MLITDTGLVSNITNLSPTHLVSIIRHQNRRKLEQLFQVDYASFHKTFEVNCPENSAMDEQQKKIERERYQFDEPNPPNPDQTLPTLSVVPQLIFNLRDQKNRTAAPENARDVSSRGRKPMLALPQSQESIGSSSGIQYTPRKIHNFPKHV